MSGPPPIECACGALVPVEEAVSVWMSAPLGLHCAKTHAGPCEELAVRLLGGRRREAPVTDRERAAKAASAKSHGK